MRVIYVTWDYDRIPITTIVVNDDRADEAVDALYKAFGVGNPHQFDLEVRTAETLEEGLMSLKQEIAEMES